MKRLAAVSICIAALGAFSQLSAPLELSRAQTDGISGGAECTYACVDLMFDWSAPSMFFGFDQGSDLEVDLDEIVQQVIGRQDQVRSIRCTWTSQKHIPRGSDREFSADGGLTETGLPDKDTLLEDTMTVVIDGRKLFWRQDAWVLNGRQDASVLNGVREEFVRLQRSAAVVGGEAVTLIDGPTGVIERAAGGQAATDLLNIWPVLAAYRLFDPVLGRVKPEHLTLVGRAEFEGHPCVVLEEGPHPGGAYRQWWLAEDQDYCPVQWQQWREDASQHFCQGRMRYEKNLEGLWYLKSWDVAWHEAWGLVESFAATPIEVRLNEPVDPGVFEIIFPPGTSVYGRLRDMDYVLGEEGHGALEKQNVVSDQVMDEFVEKLRREHLPAESAEADKRVSPAEHPKGPIAPPVHAVAPPGRLSPYHWLLIGCGVVLLVVAAGAALARRKAAR